MFYQFEDLAIAQLPKAGLTTIREWLGRDFIAVPNDQVTAKTRVAFIRNPLERHKSYFSFKHWNELCRGEEPEGWESYVDRSLSEDNEHWRPQSLIVGDVPNVIHRFEDLTKHFERYKPGLLPWHNRASRLPTTDYRYEELVAFYRDDQRLWDNAA